MAYERERESGHTLFLCMTFVLIIITLRYFWLFQSIWLPFMVPYQWCITNQATETIVNSHRIPRRKNFQSQKWLYIHKCPFFSPLPKPLHSMKSSSIYRIEDPFKSKKLRSVWFGPVQWPFTMVSVAAIVNSYCVTLYGRHIHWNSHKCLEVRIISTYVMHKNIRSLFDIRYWLYILLFFKNKKIK